MPTLNWLNRPEAIVLASKTPYRLLSHVPELSFGDANTQNMLIQGDNLDTLKALLPYYAGQVKCIFIDPPYNTGSAFEHYDDNLEHSTWLSMMYPRLELLREFLSEDGSIWVSIDDNEGHYLKVIMDEIFGRKKFIATVVWQSRYSRSNDASLSNSHNFILVYAQNPDLWKKKRNRLSRNDKQATQYTNPDNDERGPWRAIPWDAPDIRGPNLTYPIKTITGKVRMPPPGRHWSRTEDQWLEIVAAGLAYFGKNGDGAPSYKQFLRDAPAIVPNTWWNHEEVGNTDEAKKEIQKLASDGDIFATPKPERLIQRILQISTDPEDLVLDSFLGSGTTVAVAHKMNRRFVGVELGEQAVTHCFPRLKAVIEGEQGGISKDVNWQGGGGFQFYRLGEPLFDESGLIHSAIHFDTLAAHIWFYETHTPFLSPGQPSPLLGMWDGKAYYLLFNGILGDQSPEGGNVLTKRLLRALPPFDGPKVIYGEVSLIDSETLKQANIEFKKIPNQLQAR